MSKTTEPEFAVALDTGLTVPVAGASIRSAGRVLTRGDEVHLSPAFIDATRDRHGATEWPGLVSNPEAQVRRWGRIRLLPGRLAENSELLAAISAEREAAALATAQKELLESRRWGGRVRVVTVPVAAKGDENA